MKWEIDWGQEELVFGYEFAEIFAEGIEAGLAELEYLAIYGHHCDGCGQWRICATCEVEESTPTDRGDEYRLLPYELCAECQREMFTDV